MVAIESERKYMQLAGAILTRADDPRKQKDLQTQSQLKALALR